jgi:hypothetical protein
VAVAVLAIATALSAGGVEPVATWYYVFAWLPTLVLADAVIAWRTRTWFLAGRPAFALTLFLWSVPFWLVFETFNLRLANWFYVYVPDDRVARWAGVSVSFATVLPAILTSERLLATFGVARGARSRPFRATSGLRRLLQASGIASLLLSVAWPRFFFPLVWVGVGLLADPFVHARDPQRSLLGDLARGRPGRALRLLLGGLAIGFLWEIYNSAARGKWIYTVPGFEEWKLFEMPLLGFLGFPVFALQGFATWQALVVTGLAVPSDGEVRTAPTLARAAVAVLATAFVALALLAMEHGTVASTTPRIEELPGAPAVVAYGGWDVFSLARADPVDVARASGISIAAAERWGASARLAALRGIGTANARRLAAVGVGSVGALAASEPSTLARRLALRGQPVPAPRLRVWVRAAREAIAEPHTVGEAIAE